MSKPTRQQVVEALVGANVIVSAPIIADILVSAGLVEQPLEPGVYWVKWRTSSGWEPASLTDDGVWYRLASLALDWVPEIIGRRINPPEDSK